MQCRCSTGRRGWCNDAHESGRSTAGQAEKCCKFHCFLHDDSRYSRGVRSRMVNGIAGKNCGWRSRVVPFKMVRSKKALVRKVAVVVVVVRDDVAAFRASLRTLECKHQLRKDDKAQAPNEEAKTSWCTVSFNFDLFGAAPDVCPLTRSSPLLLLMPLSLMGLLFSRPSFS